jgi:cytochrome c-type biogenesis protein CcmH/NrfG
VTAFAKSTAAVEPEQPTQLEQAVAPIKLTELAAVPLPAPAPMKAAAERSLEDEFFSSERGESGTEDTDPAAAVVAAPAAIEDTYVPNAHRGASLQDESELVPARRDPAGSRWFALSVAAALLVALIGVLTWRLSTGDEEPFVAPPIVLPQAPKAEPAEQAETVPPVEVSDEQIKAALDEATKQYEEAQFGEAIATLEQIVEVAPSSVEAWLLMAMARLDNDERARSEEAAMTVLALDPNRADAFLLLATIHIREGKRDVAAGEIARYLELDPNGKHAEEAKRLLRR